MFTGIIQAVGRVAARQARGGDARLRIASVGLDPAGLHAGDSIAVNGVCLTAVELPGDGFWADVSGETLSRTALGALETGAAVNLELALLPTTRLGGHLVSGHVDGVGSVLDVRADARSWRYRIEAPASLARYIAEKGSICVDGVSLTVNGVDGAVFDVNIVPHTRQQTIIGEYRVGRRVNLEVDLIARYLERLLLGERATTTAGLSAERLRERGFLK